MTTLTDGEREELRSTARSVLGRESADRWGQIVELGWTAIHVDEAAGGAGCGYADLAVVLHEIGRALLPSPFLASSVLADRATGGGPTAVRAGRRRGGWHRGVGERRRQLRAGPTHDQVGG